LYAYRCTKCGYKFEKIQNFSARQETECPKCHGVLERPLTAPGLNFKGAGWYVNDYASTSSSSESSSSGERKQAERSSGLDDAFGDNGFLEHFSCYRRVDFFDSTFPGPQMRGTWGTQNSISKGEML
jgi:putative FmdB family regulatory protein